MLPISYRLSDVLVVRRPPGFDSGWRSMGHTLLARVRGGGFEIETADVRLAIGDGMAFLVPSGMRHVARVRGADEVRSHVVDFHAFVHESYDLFSVLTRPVAFSHADAERIGILHRALLDCRRRGSSIEVSIEVSARLAELVHVAARSCPDLATWSMPERQRLLPALRYVSSRLAEPFSHVDLARAAGLSEPHFRTLFVRAFGVPAMEFVRRERMRRARQLLHTSSLPVAEVARLCGYGDPYYFSRAFRRVEGVPPTAYRRSRD